MFQQTKKQGCLRSTAAAVCKWWVSIYMLAIGCQEQGYPVCDSRMGWFEDSELMQRSKAHNFLSHGRPSPQAALQNRTSFAQLQADDYNWAFHLTSFTSEHFQSQTHKHEHPSHNMSCLQWCALPQTVTMLLVFLRPHQLSTRSN